MRAPCPRKNDTTENEVSQAKQPSVEKHSVEEMIELS